MSRREFHLLRLSAKWTSKNKFNLKKLCPKWPPWHTWLPRGKSRSIGGQRTGSGWSRCVVCCGRKGAPCFLSGGRLHHIATRWFFPKLSLWCMNFGHQNGSFVNLKMKIWKYKSSNSTCKTCVGKLTPPPLCVKFQFSIIPTVFCRESNNIIQIFKILRQQILDNHLDPELDSETIQVQKVGQNATRTKINCDDSIISAFDDWSFLKWWCILLLETAGTDEHSILRKLLLEPSFELGQTCFKNSSKLSTN